MLIRVFLASVACVFLVGRAPADTVTSATLPNGLQVRIRADEDLALARVGMFFAAGGATDPDSLAGLAHLAEHLLTESSPAHPDGGLIRASTLYATYRNAYTSSGYMQFDTECLPEFLPQVLSLEAERLRGARPDSASFAREKAVVLEEMAYRSRWTPTSEHLEALHRACYAGHPFGKSIVGTPEALERITLADYEMFRQRYIVPRRAALVVTGPLDPDAARALVDSLFNTGPAADPEPLAVPLFPPVAPLQVVTDSPDFKGVKVSVACRVPLDDPQNTTLVLALPRLLETGAFGLNLSLVPGEALVTLSGFYNYIRPTKYRPGPFDPGQSAQDALGHLWRQLDHELDDLAAAELFAKRRQKTLDLLGKFSGLDGPALVSGMPPLSIEARRAILTELTYPQLADFVRGHLNPDRAAVGITHGRDSDRQKAIEMARRVERDEAARGEDPLARLTAAEIEPVLAAYARADLRPVAQTTLSNGVPLAYLELPGLARTRLGGCRVVRSLKVQRRGDKPGITHFYNRIVSYDDRQRRDPDAEYYRPERLPFELSFRLTPGCLTFEATGAPAELDKLGWHLARRLKSRDFNNEIWYRISRNGGEFLGSYAASAGWRANGWRMQQIFGDDYHDLGYWLPSFETSAKVRYKDLAKLHEQVAAKTGQTVLYGAGSASLSEVVAALEPTLGQRPDYRPYAEDPPNVAALTRIVGKVIPDLTRGDVALRVAFPVAAAAHAQPVATQLLLETALEQALTAHLREAEGLTYSASASHTRYSGVTVWQVHVTCQPGQAHLVLRELRRELQRITTDGFGRDEIARARLRLTGYLVRSFSKQTAGFSLLEKLATRGPLPGDLIGAVAAQDAATVNDLARQVLAGDRFAFTALGPMFEEDLEIFDLE